MSEAPGGKKSRPTTPRRPSRRRAVGDAGDADAGGAVGDGDGADADAGGAVAGGVQAIEPDTHSAGRGSGSTMRRSDELAPGTEASAQWHEQTRAEIAVLPESRLNRLERIVRDLMNDMEDIKRDLHQRGRKADLGYSVIHDLCDAVRSGIAELFPSGAETDALLAILKRAEQKAMRQRARELNTRVEADFTDDAARQATYRRRT